MDCTATPFTPEDQIAVKKMILDSLSQFSFSYDPSLDKDLDNPKEVYIDTGGIFFVLKSNHEVIGTVALKKKGNNTAELKRLYVKKNYQGMGFGSILLNTIIDYAKENGFKKITCETNKKFTKAHILYEKRGFKRMGEDENSYYMEKEL